MTAVKEAIAIASGYRNLNEMLTLSDGNFPSPADEDMPIDVAEARSRSFIRKFADALGIGPIQATAAYRSIRPFSGRSLSPRISIAQIEWLAAKITRQATEIVPVRKGYTSSEVYPGFTLKLDRQSYGIAVSENGDVSQDSEDTLARLLWKAGLSNAPRNIAPERLQGANVHIVSTLLRLDRKALFVLRCAHRFKERTYDFARTVPDGSPTMRALVEYPRLGQYIAQRYEEDAESVDLHDPSPVDTFAEEIRKLSLRKWPTFEVNVERSLEIARNYLRVRPGKDGCTPLVPAFLCQIPNRTHPRSMKQYEQCEAYLFKHGNLFDRDSLWLSPKSFGEDFEKYYGSDWDRVLRLPDHRGFMPSTIAAVVIAQAARETGYLDAQTGEFEEPEDEDCLTTVEDFGVALVQEVAFGYKDSLARLDKLTAAVRESTYKYYANIRRLGVVSDQERDHAYYDLVVEHFCHPRHRERRALDIVSEGGIDIHAFVAACRASAER